MYTNCKGTLNIASQMCEERKKSLYRNSLTYKTVYLQSCLKFLLQRLLTPEDYSTTIFFRNRLCAQIIWICWHIKLILKIYIFLKFTWIRIIFFQILAYEKLGFLNWCLSQSTAYKFLKLHLKPQFGSKLSFRVDHN